MRKSIVPILAAAFLMFLGTNLKAQSLSSQWFELNGVGDLSNNELEAYSPAQISESNGYATLTAIHETTDGQPYTSGAITWSTFNYTYGTIEFRAKMSGGTGTWPAIWLLGSLCQPTRPTDFEDVPTCNWPQAGSDEIDITEILDSHLTAINQEVHSATSNAGCTASAANVAQNYHVYDFVWTSTALTWYVDGVKTCSLPGSDISGTPKYLIVNVAVGGTGTVTPNPATLPQSTSLDYVRVCPQAVYPIPSSCVLSFDDEFGGTATPSPLEITSTSLPGGTVGSSYSETVYATDGTPPYRFSATDLPAGVTMSSAGVISGNPTVAATYEVDVTVTDSASHSASADFSLIISSASTGGGHHHGR